MHIPICLLAWYLWVWPQYTSGKPAKTNNSVSLWETSKNYCNTVTKTSLWWRPLQGAVRSCTFYSAALFVFLSVYVFLFASCWGGVGWVKWVGAIRSLHLHAHLLLCHLLFFLLRQKNFSSTSTSSARYVNATLYTSHHVLRSSLALPYRLIVTLSYIYKSYLMQRHKNFL